MEPLSVECLEKIENLCGNCRKVVLDDSWTELGAHYDARGRLIQPSRGCEEALSDWESPTKYSLTDHFPRLPKLEVSFRHGCSFCGYLREMISSKHTTDFLERHYAISATDQHTQEIQVTISFRWRNSIGNQRGNLCLCVEINLSNIKSNVILWSHVTTAAGQNDSLAKWLRITTASTLSPTDCEIRDIKSMITECKNHGHAVPSHDYVPERLLDIQEQIPKLTSCRGAKSEVTGRTPCYAALSYCWGTSEDAMHQLTTTRATILHRQRGIQYDEMPPVLRDAVNVTRSLDIPFLWIDSLCILQDDISDWESQCPQMDNIYGHAEVTLVAASSRSCRESFLRPDAPRALLPFNSMRRPGFGGLLQVEFSGCSESPQKFDGMDDSRLATRGWAVQERILSTRMIVFGRSDVHFICPLSTPITSSRHSSLSISKVRGAETKMLYAYWTQLLDEIKHITPDSFTKPTDLLPALSGLAAYFGGRLKDDYCAGHWNKDLHNSLMWLRVHSSQDPKTFHVSRICSRSPYIVPTWSRLGKGNTRTLFDYWRMLFILPCHVPSLSPKTLKLDPRISRTGENPFGLITDAQLEIFSYTMCLQTAMSTAHITVVPDETPFWPGCWSVCFVPRDKCSFSCRVWVDYDLKKEDAREDANGWKWMLLGTYMGEPFGLLLNRVNGAKWCRVGVFDASKNDVDSRNKHRPMTLQDFTKWSEIETIIVI